MTTDALSLTINTDLARKILVDFLQTEIQRSGFSRAVVGVSGGVDSSLACLLAADALGPDNVLALRMPYKTSSSESIVHAGEIIEMAGVHEKTIPITGMVDALDEFIPETDRIRRGNVMARARMLVLYDQSAEFNALVVGTGNKTEIILGYTTHYGDAACALNPIGDLYKTQVLQLAAAMGVPQTIISKPPSADLWVGQTDEQELGFTYAEVDRLLIRMIDGRFSIEDCVDSGFEKEFVEQVYERIRRNHYKHVPPIIAKVSNRTVGHDFLYLRDWGT